MSATVIQQDREQERERDKDKRDIRRFFASQRQSQSQSPNAVDQQHPNHHTRLSSFLKSISIRKVRNQSLPPSSELLFENKASTTAIILEPNGHVSLANQGRSNSLPSLPVYFERSVSLAASSYLSVNNLHTISTPSRTYSQSASTSNTQQRFRQPLDTDEFVIKDEDPAVDTLTYMPPDIPIQRRTSVSRHSPLLHDTTESTIAVTTETKDDKLKTLDSPPSAPTQTKHPPNSHTADAIISAAVAPFNSKASSTTVFPSRRSSLPVNTSTSTAFRSMVTSIASSMSDMSSTESSETALDVAHPINPKDVVIDLFDVVVDETPVKNVHVHSSRVSMGGNKLARLLRAFIPESVIDAERMRKNNAPRMERSLSLMNNLELWLVDQIYNVSFQKLSKDSYPLAEAVVISNLVKSLISRYPALKRRNF
ncbi:hypothetical protein BCR33DRAFT_711909 [Rhizoclosmatium globosum]|uniref:Uncharacterized protein n=1 Tax=Rhizoclosmatium globosum TaxID=329046 RepID=A0A1Y2D062_9FUNG|nr:hypothetical protein BCR33DRAFT_711909 [Rhizoclosmatium globosum]|eukprot:ORY52650.1 hypothetical protein BCR33DRAFT_711909 [Rhizoclosmatium globosum]